MTHNANLTVEEYGIFLLRYIDSLPHGQEKYEMQKALDSFREEILFLECCHAAESPPDNKHSN